jgi:hypothetical protein
VFNHTQFNEINNSANFASLTNLTIQNLPSVNPDGSLKNKDGFGTVKAARDPRIMQLVVRFVF